MKSKVKVERAERCDCKNPTLVGNICVGVKGFFQFCSDCKRECRLYKVDHPELGIVFSTTKHDPPIGID